MNGWFDDQLRARMKADEEMFSNAFFGIAKAVTGAGGISDHEGRDADDVRETVNEIFHFYHLPPDRSEDTAESLKQQLERMLRPVGMMCREVKLEEHWYRRATGAYLARTKQGSYVALLPHRFNSYAFRDPDTGKLIYLNKKTAALVQPEALCLYKPFPMRSMGVRDLMRFLLQGLTAWDYCGLLLISLIVALLSMIVPRVTNYVYAELIYAPDLRPMQAVLMLLLGTSAAIALFGVCRSMVLTRIRVKTDVAVRAASMMRIINMPTSFFQDYAPGELSNRVQAVNTLCMSIEEAVFSTGLTAALSLIYVFQILRFAPALAGAALTIVLAMLALYVITMLVQISVTTERMELKAKQSGLLYAFVQGIQKLRLSGGEKRAFARWASLYKRDTELSCRPPLFLRLTPVLSLLISTLGTVWLYALALSSGISVENYMAFMASYALLSGAFLALSQISLSAASIKPIIRMIRPMLDQVPEKAGAVCADVRLKGNIEISHVTFSYDSDMPPVLDDLSLKVKAGQYIAVVGRSGSGKSTLMKLLLGFETPGRGAIFYDRSDMRTMDLKQLRTQLGCVIQDSELFTGSIFSNIAISAPGLTEEAAWRAAEMAGIAEDIRVMPMGMNSLISEGARCISGGQKQRIIIARALAANPRVLLFDEATSALDNLTQKIVTDSLSSLHCTRIVIAHRLSTIKDADRIVLLDHGRIVEDGTYDALIAAGGAFKALVERQQISTD